MDSRTRLRVPIAVMLALACAPAPAQTRAPHAFTPHDPAAWHARSADGAWFAWGGIARADLLATSAELPGDSPGRDFYVPGATPVDDASGDRTFDAHARFTTLHAGGGRLIGDGHRVSAYVEADLFEGDPENAYDADASYAVSARHAYVAFDGWLAGKTWSNFMDVAAMPDSVDPIGAADGMAFLRQNQLRYTRGGLTIALEDSEMTVNPIGGGERFTSHDGNRPDVTARYTRGTAWGHWSAAVLVREFEYEAPTRTDDVIAFAAGFNGRYEFTAYDDFRFGLYAGQGFGRYVGLGAAVDANVEPDWELEEVEGFAGYASWQHVFDRRWRANLTYARAEWDNEDEVSGGLVVDHTHSLAANVTFAPIDGLELGLEARVAERVLENGASGTLERLHLVVRYAF